MSLEVASFALTYKFSEAPEALRRAFSLDLVALALNLAHPGLPWTSRTSIFEAETTVFSWFLDVCAFVQANVAKRL